MESLWETYVKKCPGTRDLIEEYNVNMELPAGFEHNGKMMFPLFKNFMDQQKLAKGTLRQYLARIKEIWKFWCTGPGPNFPLTVKISEQV